MPLPTLPLTSTLVALALMTAVPVRAEWLGGTSPSAALSALDGALAADGRFSYLSGTLADDEFATDADESVWALAHLNRQQPMAARSAPIEIAPAMPPLSAARAEDDRTVGRRVQASPRPSIAETAPAAPGPLQPRTDGGIALPDPAWIAVPGALLALLGLRTQRRKQRDRRPAMLYVAR